MRRVQLMLRLVVLAAMTISFTEVVWASACASMASKSVSDAAGVGHAMPDMPGMPGMPDGDGPEGDRSPRCPLGPAAVAQGCVLTVSLPASVIDPFGSTDEHTADVGSVEDASELIVSARLFHPPRA